MQCLTIFNYIYKTYKHLYILILTWFEWHILEFFQPLICHLNCLGLVGFSISSKPLLGCMCHHLREVIRVFTIEYIEKKFSVRALRILILVLEVDVEIFIFAQVQPHLLYWELIPVRHMNIANLILLHQFLFIGEYLFEKSFIYLRLWWHIILKTIEEYNV